MRFRFLSKRKKIKPDLFFLHLPPFRSFQANYFCCFGVSNSVVLSTLTPNSDPIPPRDFLGLRSLCVHLARLFFFSPPTCCKSLILAIGTCVQASESFSLLHILQVFGGEHLLYLQEI